MLARVMSQIVLVVATCIAVFSLLIAGLSLLLHWARGKEHPDVAPVARSLQELQLAHADLVDKVSHWQRRDRVRNLRESREAQEAPVETDPKAVKDRLRLQVFGQAAG